MNYAELIRLTKENEDQLCLAFTIICVRCNDLITPKDRDIMTSFAARILRGQHLSDKMLKVAHWKIERYGSAILKYWGEDTLNDLRTVQGYPALVPNVTPMNSGHEVAGHVTLKIDGMDEIEKALSEAAKSISTLSGVDAMEAMRSAAAGVMSAKFASEVEKLFLEGGAVDTTGRPVGLMHTLIGVDEAKEDEGGFEIPEGLKAELIKLSKHEIEGEGTISFPDGLFRIVANGFHVTLTRDGSVVFEDQYESAIEVDLVLKYIREILSDDSQRNVVFGGDHGS